MIQVSLLIFGDFILNLAFEKLPFNIIFMKMKCLHEFNMLSHILLCCYVSLLKALKTPVWYKNLTEIV